MESSIVQHRGNRHSLNNGAVRKIENAETL